MGSSSTVSNSSPRISQFLVNQSSYGAPLKLVFGTTIVSPVLIDYNDFTAIAHTTTTESGGKGGGVTNKNTSYTYTVAADMALSEGVCTGVGKVWEGSKTTDLSSLGMTFFNGYLGGTKYPWDNNKAEFDGDSKFGSSCLKTNTSRDKNKNSYIKTVHPISLGQSDFTVETWMKIGSYDNSYAMLPYIFAFAKDFDSLYKTDDLWKNNSQDIVLAAGGTAPILYCILIWEGLGKFAGSLNCNLYQNGSYLYGKWFHFAFVRKNRNVKIFLNGIKVVDTNDCSPPVEEIPMLKTGSTLFIGAPYPGKVPEDMNDDNYFYFDEFRLSTMARYKENFTPPTEPFTQDDNTISLLHFNGNLKDEGLGW